MAEKLYKKKVISKKDMFTCMSAYQKAEYNLKNSEIQLKEYSWKLADKMGIHCMPDIIPDINYLNFEMQKFDLDSILNTVRRKSYKVEIEELKLYAMDLNYHISKRKNTPSLKIEGFYGKSASSYETEPLYYKEDYQIDLKLEYSFSGNLFKISTNKDRVSPKYGESNRTEVEGVSASLGILDNMDKSIDTSDKYLEYCKQLEEYRKVMMREEKEARDAYFNWEKAVMQIHNSQKNLELAWIEFEVNKVIFQNTNSKIEDMVLSRQKVAEAELGVYKAKLGYLTAIADLNRILTVIKDRTADIDIDLNLTRI
ncbi:hypothetical protein ACFL5N_02070 [bacterium]